MSMHSSNLIASACTAATTYLVHDLLVVGMLKPIPCVVIVHSALHQHMSLLQCMALGMWAVLAGLACETYVQHQTQVWTLTGRCETVCNTKPQCGPCFIPDVCCVYVAEMLCGRLVQMGVRRCVVQQSSHLCVPWKKGGEQRVGVMLITPRTHSTCNFYWLL